MGFGNTSYTNTIDALLNTQRNLLKNDYYFLSDKMPTPVTYFPINKEASTLDEGAKIEYDYYNDSPLWFDKILDFLLYGLESITATLENNDYGAETETIEGEAIVLPNTIIPIPGDHFLISYVTPHLLFRVISSTPDTLENGANFYKINYKLETSINEIKNIKNTYRYIPSNVGTNFKAIIRQESFDLLSSVYSIIDQLKEYYKSTFYSNRVQTFVYKFLEVRFYDPFMIEFIRDNNLMSSTENYIHLSHQTILNNKFPLLYNKSFMRALEKKDLAHIRKYIISARGSYINDQLSIFYSRPEHYFCIEYEGYHPELFPVPMFKQELIDHIESGELFDNEMSYYNIIIKYFHDIDITQEDIDYLLDIDYEDNEVLFYTIPCVIFCLEKIAESKMKTE